LFHLYNSNNALLEKLKIKLPLSKNDKKDIQNLPATYLLCYFNDFTDSIDKLEEAKPYLKAYDATIYSSYKESIRVLRKVKYS